MQSATSAAMLMSHYHGEVLCDTKEIECIRHASSFSLETGKPNTLPATQPVPVYVASVDNGEVFIELN